jgi:hypothetical protein
MRLLWKQKGQSRQAYFDGIGKLLRQLTQA